MSAAFYPIGPIVNLLVRNPKMSSLKWRKNFTTVLWNDTIRKILISKLKLGFSVSKLKLVLGQAQVISTPVFISL